MATITKLISCALGAQIAGALEEDAASSIAWAVTLEVAIGADPQGSPVYVFLQAPFHTTPPVGVHPPNRLIFVAQLPGVTQWRVTFDSGAGMPTGTPNVTLTTGGVELLLSPGTVIAPLDGGGGMPPPPAGGAPVNFTGTLYVDGGTSVPTLLQTGAQNYPFKTIGQGVAALHGGQTLYLMPAVYPENVVMRDLDQIAILGSSPTNTILAPPAGDAFSWVPGAASGPLVRVFSLENLHIIPAAGAPVGVHVDATNTAGPTPPNAFCDQGFTLRNCIVEKNGGGVSLSVTCVGEVFFDGVDWGGTQAVIFNCTGFDTGAPCRGGELDLFYDGTRPTPKSGRGFYLLSGDLLLTGDVQVHGQPNFFTDRTVEISGDVRLLDLFGFFSAVPAIDQSAFAFVSANNVGRILIAMPDPPVGGLSTAQAQFSGVATGGQVQVSKVGGAITRSRVVFAQCSLNDNNPGDIRAGDLIDLDLRTSRFDEVALVAVGSGTIDRDQIAFPAHDGVVAGETVAIAPPLPSGANYTILPSCVNGNPAESVAFAGRTSAQFVAFSANAGPGMWDYILLRHNN